MNRLILLGFFVFPLALSAQIVDPALAGRLQQHLDSMRTAHNIRGISAAVLLPGQGMWQGVSGVSFGNTPIEPGMEFGIASNTKLFTAVVLLKLVENGIVALEDSLHEWLPAYPNVDGNATLRQLLNHTSGMEDVNNIPGYPDSILNDPNRFFTPDEVLHWVGPPLFAPGMGWSYSNTNYILAGEVAESATGIPLYQLIRDSILAPLQLDSTFYAAYEPVGGVIAQPWQNGVNIQNTPRTSLHSTAGAAGAMYSTASEMVQWYHALFSGQVLEPGSVQEMTAFVGPANYGLGIYKRILAGRVCFGHDGSIRGYRSAIMFDTTSKAIVCVLINSNPAPAIAVAQQLIAALADATVSTQEDGTQAGAWRVYPNPATDVVCLDAGMDKIERIEVYDGRGMLMHAGSAPRWRVTDWPAGMYFVRSAGRVWRLVKW